MLSSGLLGNRTLARAQAVHPTFIGGKSSLILAMKSVQAFRAQNIILTRHSLLSLTVRYEKEQQ
jgi:hypothetical protein